MRKYASNTCFAFNVLIGGKRKHISFEPITSGGSIYQTSDEEVQKAMEKSSAYNKFFKLVEVRDEVEKNKDEIVPEGEEGAKGPIVYPAGYYDSTVEYTTDANTAPYVLDEADNHYYVLNKQMTWLGTTSGKRPSEDYATSGDNASWIPFKQSEVVFTKPLMAKNGLLAGKVVSQENAGTSDTTSGELQDVPEITNPADAKEFLKEKGAKSSVLTSKEKIRAAAAELGFNFPNLK